MMQCKMAITVNKGTPIKSMKINGKWRKVNLNRYVWKCYHGYAPQKGWKVFKSCKNAGCIEPSHMYLDKMNQYNECNFPDRKGEANTGKVKLNNRAIKAIRKSKQGLKVLAEQYGVSSVQIWRIQKHKQWSHLD